MRNISITIILLGAIVLFAQIEYPHVQDNGGGYKESAGYRSCASIGQAVIGECSDGSVVNQAGFETPLDICLEINEKPNGGFLPEKAQIGLPYPNPFNSVCKIDVALPSNATINFAVYDLSGHNIFRQSEERPAGVYSIKFDAGKLGSGVYLYSIKVGDTVAHGKLILVK